MKVISCAMRGRSDGEWHSSSHQQRLEIGGYFQLHHIGTKGLYDMRDIRVIQVGNIVDDTEIGFKNPQRGRVYSIEGIAPTMQNWSGGGGLQPKIIVYED